MEVTKNYDNEKVIVKNFMQIHEKENYDSNSWLQFYFLWWNTKYVAFLNYYFIIEAQWT
jgi:hypothetical protein